MTTFITKSRRLELVIDPSYYEIKEGKRTLHAGKRIIFEDGKFETNNKEEVDYLLKHDGLNDKFYLKGNLIKCRYCGRYLQLKASLITHERYCKENPDRATGQPKNFKKKKKKEE